MQSSHQNSEKDNSNVESQPDQSSEVIQPIVEELEDDNLEEEEVYQSHPIHLKFIEDYSYLWSKVNVYDSVGPRR